MPISNQPVVVCLHPGQKVRVEFRDEEGEPCDGDMTVSYEDDAIRVRSNWPDDIDRGGVTQTHPDGKILYQASF